MHSLWLSPDPLVLASQSSARASLLQAAQIPYEARPADVDERAVEAEAGPADPPAAALLLARAKAAAVSAALPGRLVVGADQTLDIGGERLTKPRDRTSARRQMQQLRGRTHRLCSAVAIARDGKILWADTAIAGLTMRDFSDDFLERYLDSAGNAVLSSVGGYQLEGLGIHLFAQVEGDQSTILGLPLLILLPAFRDLGVLA